VNYLLRLLAGFAIGYWAVTRLAPTVQAKIEAYDLDAVWEIWDDEELM
jgi:hypothetical protein